MNSRDGATAVVHHACRPGSLFSIILHLSFAAVFPARAGITAPADIDGDIVVTGRKSAGLTEEGSADFTYDESDIGTFGAATIGDLIGQLSSKTQDGSANRNEQPAVLLNGRLITNLAEISDLPAEAAAQVSILSRNAGLRHGAPSAQRIVSISLKPRYKSLVVQATAETAGTYQGQRSSINHTLTRIQGEKRLNVMLSAARKPAISTKRTPREGQIDFPAGTIPITNLEQGVTNIMYNVVPAEYGFRGSISGGFRLGGDISVSPIGAFDYRSTTATSFTPEGLPVAPSVYQQRTKSLSWSLGVRAAADIGRWTSSFSINVGRKASRAESGQSRAKTPVSINLWQGEGGNGTSEIPGDPVGTRISELSAIYTNSRSGTLTGDMLANGPLWAVPAGRVTASVRINVEGTNATSKSPGDVVHVSTRGVQGQVGLNLPITSPHHDFLRYLGDLSANVMLSAGAYSGSGGSLNRLIGLNWKPVQSISLAVSNMRDRISPPVEDLASPSIVTPDVPVYDYRFLRTALVTQITGGVVRSPKTTSSGLNLSLVVAPKTLKGFTVTVDGTRITSRNSTISLPALSEITEKAFPERYIRDNRGILIAVDNRPVSIDQIEKNVGRLGLDVMRRISQVGPKEDREGGIVVRASTHLTHTFSNRMRLSKGDPVLDVSSGALRVGGGEPVNVIDCEAAISFDQAGLVLKGNWQGGTRLIETAETRVSRLSFEPLSVLSLRFFFDAGYFPFYAGDPFFKGTRITVSVNNIANARQKVRDELGNTPKSYQPVYLDALGRVFRLELRKRF
jgi:iron complex outermembrane recepter protein